MNIPFAVATRRGRFCAVHEASGRYLAEFRQEAHAAACVAALNAAGLPCLDRETLPNEILAVCHRIVAPHLEADRAQPVAPPKVEAERDIQKKIVKYLEDQGFDVERLNSGHVKTEHGSWISLCKIGTPDLLTLIAPTGRAWYIETKRVGKDARDTQARRHAQLRAQGARVDVAHSVAEVAACLAEIRRGAQPGH